MIYVQALLLLVPFLLNKTVVNATKYRLPDSTFPSHYVLRIEMNTDLGSSDNYTGQVTITIVVHYPTDLIVLHAAENLEIEQITLQTLESGESVGVRSKERETETQFLKIYTEQMLNQSEQYQLTISFGGHMQRDRTGFFLEEYQKGEFYAVTVFEPIYARKAFPCYDEPMFKATFDVEIECGKDYSVHSNAESMEVQAVDGDRKLVRFERTPPMASYLVAFIISKFDEEVRDFDGLKIGMITPPNDQQEGDFEFAFRATWFSVDGLQNYTGQKYPFSKLDQVGIDYFFGGLENWGLILYITDALVVNSQADDWDKVESVRLIAHEVAHQFFGNLVGLTWWEHLWLKEGFATFMSFKLTREFLPEAWILINHQNFIDRWDALHFDAGPMTYPMSNYVESPEAIGVHYTAEIVYNKAACVIRMMEAALGEEVFKAGVQDYIANDRFGTADPYKLYLSLHRFAEHMLPSEAHVAEIFHSWATQAGHPVVHVEMIGESNYYRLTQRKYCDTWNCNGSRWWIPIFYSSYELGERFAGWFSDATDVITVVMDGDLPLVNNGGYGFYRVSYCQRGWEAIIKNWNRLDGISRAKLIDDAFALFWNHGNTFGPLKAMLQLLRTESDPLPWLAAMGDRTLGKLLHMVKGRSELEPIVQQLARNLTLDMLKLFRNDTRIESSRVRQRALVWEERLKLTNVRAGRTNIRFELCAQIMSPDFMVKLRCNAKFLIKMLQNADLEKCFSESEDFDEFLDNLLKNFECPEVLNVVLAELEMNNPASDQFVESLFDKLYNLQTSIDTDQLDGFLKEVIHYIYKPHHQQLYRQFIDRLKVISEDQRSTLHHLLDLQQSRVDDILKELAEIRDSHSMLTNSQ
ncbi:AAEL003012-PA [Aedes aegypti]|uniref:Aminopeptidase n=1 Tax=Aedes aegypti TaxID=7159 RepID=Q17GG2_AEDAE|nr:AAEL003012-PA [Aedes aegypti]